MRSRIFTLGMLIFLLSACNAPATGTPAHFETPIPIATNRIRSSGVVTLNHTSFTIPLGVAQDALSEMASAVTDPDNAGWWEVAPEHLEFTLTGYQVQDKMLEPQIFVYPAEEYAKLNPNQPNRFKN